MKKIIYILVAFIITVAIACSKESTGLNNEPSSVGIGGSTARFTIVGNTLYTVDHANLNVFNITNPKAPIKLGKTSVGNDDIETIFARDNNTVFIGSQSAMYIYNIANPLLLTRLAVITHFRSCDPVVANQNYAFVTLNSEGFSTTNRCGGSNNSLRVYDVKNIHEVKDIGRYNLTKPKGLGLHGNNLFVCDNLLRWYDISNPEFNFKQKKEIVVTAHDIIPLDSSLILVGNDGITQLAFQNDSIWFLSKILTTVKQ